MPSLENRSIHLLGSFKSYPRRCLAVSQRSLPHRYCCSHTSKHTWRSFDWFDSCSFHKKCAVFSYISEEKNLLTHLHLPFSFFSRKLPSWSDGILQCHSSIYWWFTVLRCLLETPTPMEAAWGTNRRIWNVRQVPLYLSAQSLST